MNNLLPWSKKVYNWKKTDMYKCINDITIDCVYYDECFNSTLGSGGSNKVGSRKIGCHQESDIEFESFWLSGEPGYW